MIDHHTSIELLYLALLSWVSHPSLYSAKLLKLNRIMEYSSSAPLLMPETIEVTTENFGTLNSFGFYSKPVELCMFAYKCCKKSLLDSKISFVDKSSLLSELHICQDIILKITRRKVTTVVPQMGTSSTQRFCKTVTGFVRNPRTGRCLFISLRHSSLAALNQKADLARLNTEWSQLLASDKGMLQLLSAQDKVRKEFEHKVVKRLQLIMSFLMQNARTQRKLKRRSAFYCFLRHMSEFKVAPKREVYIAMSDAVHKYYSWRADHRVKAALETLFKSTWEIAGITWQGEVSFNLTNHEYEPDEVSSVLDEVSSCVPGMHRSDTLWTNKVD